MNLAANSTLPDVGFDGTAVRAALADVAPPRAYKLTSIASVKARPITWLLPGRVPYSALTVCAGRPGQGKSQFTLKLAADLSRAGVPSILLAGEDALEDTVKPRLLAAGADPAQVHGFAVDMPGGEGDMALLPTDVPLLERAVKDTGAGLVVIDPFAAHLSPELNSNNDHSLRQATAPLARMAQRTGAAVIVVAHLKKAREGSPMDWIGGSGGLVGNARSVLLFGGYAMATMETSHYRYVCHVKCNGAELASTLQCSIEGADIESDGTTIPTSRLLMLADVSDVGPLDLE